MDWIVPVLEQWCTEVWQRFGATAHPAVGVTERADRMSLRRINEAFTAARDAAGLDPSLDLHCLRHSYVTHLIEFDYPEKFVSAQVGHSYAASTAIYSGVSDEYRNAMSWPSMTCSPPPISFPSLPSAACTCPANRSTASSPKPRNG
jgi:site-specific recombinase XerD